MQYSLLLERVRLSALLLPQRSWPGQGPPLGGGRLAPLCPHARQREKRLADLAFMQGAIAVLPPEANPLPLLPSDGGLRPAPLKL